MEINNIKKTVSTHPEPFLPEQQKLQRKRTLIEENESSSKKKCISIAQDNLKVMVTDQNNQIIENVVWVSAKTSLFFFDCQDACTHYLQIINRVYRVSIAKMADDKIILPRHEYTQLKSPKTVFVTAFDPLAGEVYPISSATVELKAVYKVKEPIFADGESLRKKILCLFSKEIIKKNRVFFMELNFRVIRCCILDLKLQNGSNSEELFFGQLNENSEINFQFSEGVTDQIQDIAAIEEKKNAGPIWTKEGLNKKLNLAGFWGLEAHLETLLMILISHASANPEKKNIKKKPISLIKYLSLSGKPGVGKRDLIGFILKELDADPETDIFLEDFNSPSFDKNCYFDSNEKEARRWSSILHWVEKKCTIIEDDDKKLNVVILNGFSKTFISSSNLSLYEKIRDVVDASENILVVFLENKIEEKDFLCTKFFERRIELKDLDEYATRQTLEFFIKKFEIPPKEIDYEEVLKAINGFSRKKIEEVVYKSCVSSKTRWLSSQIENDPQKKTASPVLTQKDFEAAIKDVQQKADKVESNHLNHIYI